MTIARLLVTLCVMLGFAAGPANPSQRPFNGQMAPDPLEYPTGEPIPPRVPRIAATVISDRDTVTTGDSLFVEIRVENQGDSAVHEGFNNSCTVGLRIEDAEQRAVSTYNCHMTGTGIIVPGRTVVFLRYGIAIVPGKHCMMGHEQSPSSIHSGQLCIEWPSVEGRVVPGTYYLVGGVLHPRFPQGRKAIVVR